MCPTPTHGHATIPSTCPLRIRAVLRRACTFHRASPLIGAVVACSVAVMLDSSTMLTEHASVFGGWKSRSSHHKLVLFCLPISILLTPGTLLCICSPLGQWHVKRKCAIYTSMLLKISEVHNWPPTKYQRGGCISSHEQPARRSLLY